MLKIAAWSAAPPTSTFDPMRILRLLLFDLSPGDQCREAINLVILSRHPPLFRFLRGDVPTLPYSTPKLRQNCHSYHDVSNPPH